MRKRKKRRRRRRKNRGKKNKKGGTEILAGSVRNITDVGIVSYKSLSETEGHVMSASEKEIETESKILKNLEMGNISESNVDTGKGVDFEEKISDVNTTSDFVLSSVYDKLQNDQSDSATGINTADRASDRNKDVAEKSVTAETVSKQTPVALESHEVSEGENSHRNEKDFDTIQTTTAQPVSKGWWFFS